ncbi:hypothetical protein B0H14DRAFT_3755089 [Mycena olivaceomarginata]|nr:hypothetical protein B0H14DRAFT_3755089 [Mycena olivaceomarginata]
MTKCRSLITVPVMLATWSKSSAVVKYLKTLDRILFAGRPLPQRIGDDPVKQRLRLMSAYGATEFGALLSLIPYEDDIKEWAWFRVSPLVKVRWAPQGDGTFECQILAWENHTAMVDNLDDIKGYVTSDLCVNHPQKKHLWKLVGRLDEVITHSSGEKTVLGPMQDIIMSGPHITSAGMFGCERPQVKIDVHNVTQLAELRTNIWPIIEEANENAAAFSRIFKKMILIASSDKPLPRAGKGTIQSKAAINVLHISKPSSSIARYNRLPRRTQSNNTRASPARDKAAQPAAAYRVIHDLVVLVHGVLCHRGRHHAGPRPSRCVGRTVRRTLPASLAPLLPSFGHGSRLASSTAASSSTLALRTFNPPSSSHALSAYPASETPTPGPIPLRAAEFDSDGRRVQIQGVRADDDVARVGEHPLASRSTPLLTFSPPSFQRLPWDPLLNSSHAFEGLFHEESGGDVSTAASGRARLPDPDSTCPSTAEPQH